MHEPVTVRISYPVRDSSIVLRTDADWDRNVEAEDVREEGTLFEFTITSDRPYVYFKPVLIDANGEHWSRGNNYLAVFRSQKTRHVYPHFFDEGNDRLTPPIDVGEGDDLHRVRVYTPPGYAENSLKRYPVLYMHDAPNLFDPQESFSGEHWQVAETFGILDSMNLIRKAVVVGIYPNDRMNEYVKPGYERYAAWIAGTLKPWVDATHRTLTGPEDTAMMGSSLGGVVSFFMGWEHSDVVGNVACLSSTFSYSDDLLDRVASEPPRSTKIYLDSGWPEDNYEVTRAMYEVLTRRGHDNLLYFAYPRGVHNESSWAMRSHIPYQYFFGKSPSF